MNNQVYVMGFTDKEMTLLKCALSHATFDAHNRGDKPRANDYWSLYKRIAISHEFDEVEDIEPLTITGE